MPTTSPTPRLGEIYSEATKSEFEAFLRKHKLEPVAVRPPKLGEYFVPLCFYGSNEKPWLMEPGTVIGTRLIVRRANA